METKRKDDYDPWDIVNDGSKTLSRREVRNARSRNQEAGGSEKVENPETPGREVHSLGSSSEAGTPRRPHDIGTRTHKEKGKLQSDGKKGKKARWILGMNGKYRKRRIKDGKKKDDQSRRDAESNAGKEEGKTS